MIIRSLNWPHAVSCLLVATPLKGADGRIYASNQTGDTFVLSASDPYELLATNTLDDGCMAGLPENDQCLLRAMGVHEHCELRVCKPGEPCIIEVERTRVGLSGPVANQLMVTPCDGAADAG